MEIGCLGRTAALSADRLIAPLEITTSHELAARGRSSKCPSTKRTWSRGTSKTTTATRSER
jgi:hypothetical protein